MPINFAALTPHPPILIPTIGKENLNQLKETKRSFSKLKDRLASCMPETIIIISPHGPLQEEAFTLNLCPQYKANFEDFGDFSTKNTWSGDVGLAHQIKEALETRISLQMTSQEELDHGTSIPLMMLADQLPAKIIPLYYSGLDNLKHYEFGLALNSVLQKKTKKIAVIASGDLSHRLTKTAPGGYSSKGKKFDKRLIELLNAKNYQEILKIEPGTVEEAAECGLKSILILSGILEKIKHQPKLLSYEFPFGVGYLTMDFLIE